MYRLKGMANFIKSFLACAALAALSACAQKDGQTPAGFDTYFDMSVGGIAFRAQMAVKDVEKMRGLMFRDSLGENDGMMFVYQTPSKASFWMKNTYIPLDLAFFDKNGVLTEVKKLYPQNLDSVVSARSDILYCLEMNSGWFEKNKISSGDKLDAEKLKKALKARGFTK